MTLLPGRPLIRNTIHPNDLFTDDELTMLKECHERSWKRSLGKSYKPVNAQDRAILGHLLEQARFNGYWMNHIDEHGHLVWGCMIYEPSKKPRPVTTITSCEKCSTNFHAYHYETTLPASTCNDCVKKR